MTYFRRHFELDEVVLSVAGVYVLVTVGSLVMIDGP